MSEPLPIESPAIPITARGARSRCGGPAAGRRLLASGLALAGAACSPSPPLESTGGLPVRVERLLDPGGQFVYTCDNASNQITKIATATDTVSATIALSGSPRDAVAK